MSFSGESESQPAGQASHQAQCLQRIFCFQRILRSIPGTDRGLFKGRNHAEGNTVSSPAQGRQRTYAGISAAMPPFLLQRWNLPKIHTDLIHTLQLTENPHRGAFCLRGYKTRCQWEAEKTDVAPKLTLSRLWPLPCSRQRPGHAQVLSRGEMLTLPAWLSAGARGTGISLAAELIRYVSDPAAEKLARETPRGPCACSEGFGHGNDPSCTQILHPFLYVQKLLLTLNALLVYGEQQSIRVKVVPDWENTLHISWL